MKLVVNLGYTRCQRSDVKLHVILKEAWRKHPYVAVRVGKYAMFMDNSERIWERRL